MKINPSDVYIFLGPSLAIDTAKNTLPSVNYFEPIRCGDIIALMRHKPKIIGIIDGYFEYTASIWHKEILYALNSGIIVLGAGSMGALRAAELYPYGMQGIGKIFELYKNGIIEDDDEVALSHGPASVKYTPLSEPFVNIRINLELVRKKRIISMEDEQALIKVGKLIFYKERSFQKIIDGAKAQKIITEEVANKLQSWLDNHGIVDQKKEDALSLLKTVRKQMIEGAIQSSRSFLNRSMFLRALQHKIGCDGKKAGLPKFSAHERVISASFNLPKISQLITRYGYLLSIVYALDTECMYTVQDWKSIESIFCPDWEHSHNCSPEFKSEFLNRVKTIFLKSGIKSSDQLDEHTKCMVLNLLRLSDQFSVLNNHFKNSGTSENNLKFFSKKLGTSWEIYIDTAKLLKVCYGYLLKQQLMPSTSTIHRYIEKFYRQRKITNQSQLDLWLSMNELTIEEFNELMIIASCFDYIIARSNLDILKINYPEESIWWYQDALLLSGFYQQLKPMAVKEIFSMS